MVLSSTVAVAVAASAEQPTAEQTANEAEAAAIATAAASVAGKAAALEEADGAEVIPSICTLAHAASRLAPGRSLIIVKVGPFHSSLLSVISPTRRGRASRLSSAPRSPSAS